MTCFQLSLALRCILRYLTEEDCVLLRNILPSLFDNMICLSGVNACALYNYYTNWEQIECASLYYYYRKLVCLCNEAIETKTKSKKYLMIISKSEQSL